MLRLSGSTTEGTVLTLPPFGDEIIVARNKVDVVKHCFISLGLRARKKLGGVFFK